MCQETTFIDVSVVEKIVVGKYSGMPGLRGQFVRHDELPCPYCTGPLEGIVSDGLNVARCTDDSKGRLGLIGQLVPAGMLVLKCQACRQAFTTHNSHGTDAPSQRHV